MPHRIDRSTCADILRADDGSATLHALLMSSSAEEWIETKNPVQIWTGPKRAKGVEPSTFTLAT